MKKTADKVYKTVVPLHRTLVKGTLKDIMNQAGINREDLLKLLTIVFGINMQGY